MIKRENRHVLKLTGVTPELAGKIACEVDGDNTECDFSVTGKKPWSDSLDSMMEANQNY